MLIILRTQLPACLGAQKMQCQIQSFMYIQLLKITVNQIQLLCFTQITQLHERKIILLR